jgi:hypothetical protein
MQISAQEVVLDDICNSLICYGEGVGFVISCNESLSHDGFAVTISSGSCFTFLFDSTECTFAIIT